MRAIVTEIDGASHSREITPPRQLRKMKKLKAKKRSKRRKPRPRGCRSASLLRGCRSAGWLVFWGFVGACFQEQTERFFARHATRLV